VNREKTARMNWSTTLKRVEAHQRREERTAKKRQRELEKLLKEQAKLSALEQARLEVEAFENKLDVLLSVHRDVSPTVDWLAAASVLPPFQRTNVDTKTYDEQLAAWQKLHLLAKGVLRGDASAYGAALSEVSSFGELATLGYSISFSVENRMLIECELRVDERDVIPTQVMSLTSAGKLTSKAMPKARFHELYQDYVCGCVLRVAREVFALLPVDLVIVTAVVSSLQTTTGKEVEIPVLSAAMPRDVMDSLEFERLDPSDAMNNFVHRGDVLASKKTGDFSPVEPLKADDLASISGGGLPCDGLWARIREMRARIHSVVLKKGSTPTK
jgi:hypothetical protein